MKAARACERARTYTRSETHMTRDGDDVTTVLSQWSHRRRRRHARGGARAVRTRVHKLYACTDDRNTGGTTDELDSVDVVDGETRLGEGLLERNGVAIKDRRDELLVGITR